MRREGSVVINFPSQGRGENAADQKRLAADFVRACAVDLHMDISQESAHAEMYWA